MELFEVPIGIAIIANICESVDLHDRIDPWIKCTTLLFAPPSSWYLNSSGRVASLWSPDRTHPQRQHQCAMFNTFEFGTVEAIMILQVVDWKGHFLRILSTNPSPWSSLPFLHHKTDYWHFLNCKRLSWSSDFLSKGWRFSGCFIAKQHFPKYPITDWQVQTYLGRDLMPGFGNQGVVKLGEAKMIDRMTV